MSGFIWRGKLRQGRPFVEILARPRNCVLQVTESTYDRLARYAEAEGITIREAADRALKTLPRPSATRKPRGV